MRLLARKYIHIWKTFFSNSLTRDMEFKANFISNIGVDLIYYLSLYLFYHVIFQFTDSIGSFNKDVVIIFLIVTYMIDSFFEFLFGANIYSFNQMIIKGGAIGKSQELNRRYPGITEHVHLEIKDQNNEFLDPNDFI